MFIKNKTNKILVIIIILLLFFVSLQKCNNTVLPSDTKVTTSDTTYYTHIDTIPFYNVIDSIRWYNLPIISKDIDSNEITYVTEVNDSLIDGNITTVVKTDGTLVNQDFVYVPKFPKYIIKHDSTVIDNSTTITKYKDNKGFYGGLMVAPYKTIALIGTIGYKTKKDMYVGIGLDPINQLYYLDIKIKIK